MNTYDWFSAWQMSDSEPFDIVEISFKNGSRKEFYRNPKPHHWTTKDYVAVDTGSGFDVGQITLSGEMVRLQMKKKRVRSKQVNKDILRQASQRDMERMVEAREKEKLTLTRARAIIHSLLISMKLGDVEYQADLRKATFYYTADGRIDFRELVRSLAKEFNIKVEMRQIGARQESARLGGIGSCGRELCCSTWLSDFQSVQTTAARYQNLAINQVKLSGQCGRLKCCLNYELDTYIDALDQFPMKATKIKTQIATAHLVKADIFKNVMYYSYLTEYGRNTIIAIDKDRVAEIYEMNRNKEIPDVFITEEDIALQEEIDFADVTGVIELKEEVKKRRRNRKKKNRNRTSAAQAKQSGANRNSTVENSTDSHKQQSKDHHSKSRRSKSNNRRKPSNNQDKDRNKS